ncbi:MAG: Archaeal Type pilin, N-terminal [Thermoplasmata archaeon]|jgi:flagellin-like protein|nr:Archaeal Type pilin, N-terminal [Thermoplasmata archaeon]
MKANQAFSNNDEAVSPVIGVILMVAITVVLAAVVFVLVTRLAGNQEDQSPSITFNKQSDSSLAGGTLTVIAVQGAPDNGLVWGDVEIKNTSGTAACTKPTGALDAGDVIVCSATDGDGPFYVRYIPTNTLIYTAQF